MTLATKCMRGGPCVSLPSPRVYYLFLPVHIFFHYCCSKVLLMSLKDAAHLQYTFWTVEIYFLKNFGSHFKLILIIYIVYIVGFLMNINGIKCYAVRIQINILLYKSILIYRDIN